MKSLLLSALWFISIASSAQNISYAGIISDSETKAPVIAASIALKGLPFGTITNEDGAFRITGPANAIVAVSSIGYIAREIPASEFTAGSAPIMLQPDMTVLDEIIVSRIPVEELLEKIVSVSRARFNKPIVLHTYYREFVKINGRHSRFADGLLDYHLTGNAKNTKSDLIVKQSRVAQLRTEAELEDEDTFDAESNLNVKKAVADYYDFDYLSKAIIKNADNYDFELKSVKDKGNSDFCIIHFQPKADSEKFLATGNVLYDQQTNLIYDVDIYTADEQKKHPRKLSLLGVTVSYEDRTGHSAYKMAGSNYVLSYANRYNRQRVSTKKKLNEAIEFRSDIVVTDFSKEVAYGKKDVFSKKDLFSNGNSYTSKFWMQNNAIVLTSDEERIIAELEKSQVAEKPMPSK